jgi:alpha-beta hydrolase superfamily lysophospholipase
MAAVVSHFERVVGGLQTPPILMGHSQGGVVVQILLDHGFGAAGVAIHSVPAEGVPVVPLSQIKAILPALRDPLHPDKAVPFTPAEFHYAFTNTLSEAESAKAYERYYIPAPGRFIWGGVLANVTPGRQDTYVNFRNDDRAPLLFISGGEDHIMPASVNESNARHYSHSKAVTEYKEFPGRSHYTVGQPGWEEVADYALDWAVNHAASPTIA